jgi:hypothetical protein
VEPAVVAKPFIDFEKSPASKRCVPRYHIPVSGSSPVCRSANAFAHLSTQPNTIEYGRYSVNRFARSSNSDR